MSAPAGRRALFSWALYDWANQSFATVIQTFVFAAYFTSSVVGDPASGTAMWGNAVGLAGLVIAVGGPIAGAVTDQTGRDKPWIAAFTLLCVASTAALWWVTPDPSSIPLAMVLVVVGTIGAEFAVIFYNAMLPALAPPDRIGRWSGWAWGLGYAGGLASLVVVLVVFVDGEGAWLGLDASNAAHVRAAFPFAAAWYLVFSLPLFVFTPDRPSTGIGVARALRGGFRQIRGSLRDVGRYRHILWFLLARMLYIDGLATLFAFGGVYAAGTFGMDARGVLMFGIALNVTAGIGAFGFAWVDDRFGARRTIVISLLALVVLGTTLLLVRSAGWFWVLGLLLGIFVGPVQAASRSWLARVAPPALRNQVFGLYALSGKATAFLGPLLVGWLSWAVGSQRVGMSVIVVLFAAGLMLMAKVPREVDAPTGIAARAH